MKQIILLLLVFLCFSNASAQKIKKEEISLTMYYSCTVCKNGNFWHKLKKILTKNGITINTTMKPDKNSITINYFTATAILGKSSKSFAIHKTTPNEVANFIIEKLKG